MLISTRGRYALRMLVDLAEHAADGYVPMRDIAQRQDISLKYLERILPTLTKGGIVIGHPGKGGGYRLVHPPEQCRIGDILRLTEGAITSVACLEDGAASCPHTEICRTYPLWQALNDLVNDFLDQKTLADLMDLAIDDVNTLETDGVALQP